MKPAWRKCSATSIPTLSYGEADFADVDVVEVVVENPKSEENRFG